MPRSSAARLAFACLLGLAFLMPLVPPGETLIASKTLAFLALAIAGTLLLLFDALGGGSAPALGTPTDLALGAFFATAIPAALFAVSPGMARYQLGELLATALTFVVAVKTLRTPRDVRVLLGAVLAAAVVIAVLGLLAYRGFAASGAPESARSGALATALFPHSYLAAQYLVMVLVGGLVLLLERGLSRGWTIAVAAALVPIGTYLLAIGSRGAYLAIVVAALAHVVLRVRAQGRGRGIALLVRAAGVLGLVAALLVLATLAGLVPGVAGHAVERVLLFFDPQASDFNFSRLRIWSDSLRMAADHLLTGVGPGSFDRVLPSYHYATRSVPHAHNQYLHVLAELGLPGLIAFLFVLRHAAQAVRKGAAFLARDEERRAPFHAACAALVAALVYFLFETPLKWPEAGSLIMILLALVTRAGCVSRERVTGRVPAAAGLVAIAAMLGVVYPSWISYGRAGALAVQSAADEQAARAAQAAGDLPRAAALMDRALDGLLAADRCFPWRANMLTRRAELLFSLGRYEEALADSRLADARQPRNFRTLNAIGIIEMQLGRPELAIDPLRGAISSHRGPESAETFLALGRAYYAVERYEEAWVVFSDLLSIYYQEVRPALLLDTARTLINLDRSPALARQMLESYARKAPNADPAYLAELRTKLDETAARPRRPLGPY
jgi:O-antigen ligase